MLVTTILYLILTFASEIQRRVDFMYNNNDYGNILMIIYLSSLRNAHAGSRIINHQVKGLASLDACKRGMWITYQQIAYLSTGYNSAK